MYQLYFKKGTCSLAPHALLNFLEAKSEYIDASKVDNYKSINPTGAVPFLVDGNVKLQEGAAIAMYLMEKHNSPMFPKDVTAKANNNQWMMFANATLHPTYSRLFFIMKNITDKAAQDEAYSKTYARINELWQIADKQLAKTKYIAGDEITMADIFMTVYSGWNTLFGNNIVLGDNVTRMVNAVSSTPAFKKSVEEESKA